MDLRVTGDVPTKVNVSPSDEASIVEMAKRGDTHKMIGKALGLSWCVVRRVRAANGLIQPKRVQTELANRMEEIEQRYLAGEGSSKLAKEHHTCPIRLRKLLIERGITMRQNDHSDVTRAEVIRLHRESNLFSHEICTRHDVSESAYTKWTHGIERMNAPKRENPMTGQHFYDVWVRRHGQAEADKRMDAFREQCRQRSKGSGNPMFGRPTPRGAGNGWKGWYRDLYFRSLRELSFMLISERDGVEWIAGETLRIAYIDTQGTERTYRPDFICGRDVIELKPAKLINTPAVRAKTAAAQAYCAEHGLSYKIFDCGIDLDLIQHAYESGLLVFARDYAVRFETFLTASLPASETSQRDAA